MVDSYWPLPLVAWYVMAYWRELFGDFMLEVEYEQMVAEQEGQTRRLLEYCGLEWHEDCLEFYKTRRNVATSSVSQVRQPIYNGSVQAWKRYKKQLKPLRTVLEGRL